MVSSSALPLNVGTNPDLRAFLGHESAGLRPGYRPPVEETVLSCVEADWQQFKRMLSTELDRCSVTALDLPFASLLHDMCTFISKDTCLGYSVGFITLDWKYVLIACGLISHNFSHKAVDVARSIKDDFEDQFKIRSDRTFTSVRSDTTASALKVAESFGLEGEMCTMHLLNLVQLYGLGMLHRPGQPFAAGENLITRHSGLANHFSRSTMDLELLEKTAGASNVAVFNPSPRNDTRVSSTTNMLLANLANRGAYELLFRLKGSEWEHASLKLTRAEWATSSHIEGSLRR